MKMIKLLIVVFNNAVFNVDFFIYKGKSKD